MPAYRGLTKEQKRQAEAAIYGVPADIAMSPSQLTPEEIERMRAIVAQHDRGANQNEFDLNAPKQKPYRYEEFPRLMYNHATRAHRPARNQAELDAALEAGWSKEPFPADDAEAGEPELDATNAAAAAATEKRLEEARAEAARKKAAAAAAKK
jgi:hypothetical protein